MKKSKFAIDDFEIVEEFKYCKNCHTKNTKKAKFCFECGSKDFVDSLEPKNTNVKYCAKCGQEVKKSAKFCFECGHNKFVDSIVDEADNKEFEIDSKYQAKMDDISKKMEKLNNEISKIRKMNLEIEKEISSNEKTWKNKFAKLADEELVLINKNKELTQELEGYQNKLATIKADIKTFDNKTKAINKKVDQANNKTKELEKQKQDISSKLKKLNDDKTEAQKSLLVYERAQQEKRRREEQARIKAAQDAERARQEALARAKAIEEEIKRKNSPEAKFPTIESKWKSFATWQVINDLIEVCNAGYSKAFFILGVAYEYGYDVTQSIEKAKYWYQKAAASGDPKGRLKSGNVGVKYYNSSDVTLLVEMANLQDVTAMWTLGRYYQNSSQIGAMGNATNWYEFAGVRDKKNSGEAFFLAGECCRKNYGSCAKALSYYVRSGESGYKPAQKYLMDSYKNTNPILYIDKKDPEKYQYWYEKYKSRW